MKSFENNPLRKKKSRVGKLVATESEETIKGATKAAPEPSISTPKTPTKAPEKKEAPVVQPPVLEETIVSAIPEQRKAGRPTKTPNIFARPPKREFTVSARVSQPTKDGLGKFCADQGVSESQVIDEALKYFLANYL